MSSRVPISAADIARLLETIGVDRVISVDLHCGQIQVLICPRIFNYLILKGFFSPRVPVDNLEANIVGMDYFIEKFGPGNFPNLENSVIISPDAGI
jgi:ribose-phosphate pyrophosphokinase